MPGGEEARLVLLGSTIQVQQGRVSGGREKRAAGYPVQNNSHGYERFFVPRIGCIFVDSDSSLNTPGAEPRRVCAVRKALGRRLAWLVLTQPCRRGRWAMQALSPSWEN